MSEDMIRWYNELVQPEDRVYILGDVAFNRKALDRSVPRLLGRKILIRGNHDNDKLSYYSQYFDDIRGVCVKKGFVMTHVPVHPDCMERWGVNIHGHLHGNLIKDKSGKIDKRYINVCVEKTNFRPILLSKVLESVSQ
jgi:calcineurin-like phosphoesterase family protein